MTQARILALCVWWLLSGLVFAADKSVIVGFHERPGHKEKTLVQRADGTIRRNFRLIPAMVVSLPEERIAALRRNATVAYVEENALYQAAQCPLVKPLVSQERRDSWGVAQIFADVAHASGNKGAGVRVAILDTGMDSAHEDLDANYETGYDFVFDDDDPSDDSYNSHGTHVAGIVAAEENGVGIVGVAPEVELYVAKVLDGGGFGTTAWIIAGIEWAVQHDVDIINLSIQGPDRQALHDACDMARSAGVLLVAAGGNSLAGGGPVRYPAAYDSVIGVTATDQSDLPAYFAPVGESLELAAPGVDILSTSVGGTYHSLSGTSQAAPHVTGAAALLIVSNRKDLSGDGVVDHDDVRLILQQTAIDLGDPGKDAVYGYGLTNVAEASLASGKKVDVTRTAASPNRDAERLRVEGLPYDVTLSNRGLTKVTIDVFEGRTLREDLSESFYFGNSFRFGNKRRPQKMAFRIDATGARFCVLFTPYGDPGASATIVLTRGGE